MGNAGRLEIATRQGAAGPGGNCGQSRGSRRRPQAESSDTARPSARQGVLGALSGRVSVPSKELSSQTIVGSGIHLLTGGSELWASRPHWKEKSCLGPHVKYIVTCSHTHKESQCFKLIYDFVLATHRPQQGRPCDFPDASEVQLGLEASAETCLFCRETSQPQTLH